MTNFGSYIPERYSPKFIQPPQEELQFTQFLVERAKNAAFCLGVDARFLYVNNATCSLVQYSREELLLMSMNAIDSDFSPTAWAERWQMLRQRGSLTVKVRLLTKLGRVIPAEITLIHVEDNGREFSCAFARKQLDEALKISIPKSVARLTDSGTQLQTKAALQQNEAKAYRALEQTKQLSQLKPCFISIVCHQFRSLLNIISFSNSLLIRRIDQLPNEKKQHYLNHVEIAVKQLSQLLDEIMFYEKLEVGKQQFEPVVLDLNLLCADLVAQTHLISKEEQVIDFVSQGNCSTACMDKKLLQHILMNLLSNAIKYSPSGSKVKFRLLFGEESIIFQIQDTGIGIPAAEQHRLFEPFYRGSNVGDIPGVGLGLAIVKNLVDLHGGQIAVESEVGVGTTFTVTLPLFSESLVIAQENSSSS